MSVLHYTHSFDAFQLLCSSVGLAHQHYGVTTASLRDNPCLYGAHLLLARAPHYARGSQFVLQLLLLLLLSLLPLPLLYLSLLLVTTLRAKTPGRPAVGVVEVQCMGKVAATIKCMIIQCNQAQHKPARVNLAVGPTIGTHQQPWRPWPDKWDPLKKLTTSAALVCSTLLCSTTTQLLSAM